MKFEIEVIDAARITGTDIFTGTPEGELLQAVADACYKRAGGFVQTSKCKIDATGVHWTGAPDDSVSDALVLAWLDYLVTITRRAA